MERQPITQKGQQPFEGERTTWMENQVPQRDRKQPSANSQSTQGAGGSAIEQGYQPPRNSNSNSVQQQGRVNPENANYYPDTQIN